MNVPPPPPPPPPGPPPITAAAGVDRRALRAQRRAAQVTYRHQRTMQRLQARAMRPRSVLGPVMLVGTGCFLLAIELGHIHADAALFWMARWWPLVLLGAGLVLLLEWAVDLRANGVGQTVVPRRTLGPFGVLLIGLVTVAGIAAMGIRNGSDWMRGHWGGELADTWGLDQLLAQHSETDQDLSAALAPGGLLTIQNYRGEINVSGGSPDGQVHVSVHQRLQAWRQDELQARQQRDQPQIKPNGSGLLLIVPGADRDHADLTIEVPHESALAISPEKGDVSVSELRGAVTVGEHSGNVTLTGLTGHVFVTARDDDATITGHSLTGDVTLQGRSGDLAFSDVTGSLTLHGNFFGTTHLERIHGPLHFQSSFTDFACAGLPGELNIEGRSEFQGDNLDGPVVLSTTDRNVTLQGVRHGLTLTNRNGSNTLALTDPLGAVNVTNANGSVELRVPQTAAFSLQAETADGQVSNDLGLSPQRDGKRTVLAGRVGKGGPVFTLHNSEGDITISRIAAKVASDEDADADAE